MAPSTHGDCAVAKSQLPLYRRPLSSLVENPMARPKGMPWRLDKRRPRECGAHKETKMPKLKTKSGVKKRFKLTATGKIKHGVAGKRHRLISHNAKYIRQNRGTEILADADTARVKAWAPYGLKQGRPQDGTRQTGCNHPGQAQADPGPGEGLLRPSQEHDPSRPPGRREGRAVRLSRPQGEEAELPRFVDPANQRGGPRGRADLRPVHP